MRKRRQDEETEKQSLSVRSTSASKTEGSW